MNACFMIHYNNENLYINLRRKILIRIEIFIKGCLNDKKEKKYGKGGRVIPVIKHLFCYLVNERTYIICINEFQLMNNG